MLLRALDVGDCQDMLGAAAREFDVLGQYAAPGDVKGQVDAVGCQCADALDEALAVGNGLGAAGVRVVRRGAGARRLVGWAVRRRRARAGSLCAWPDPSRSGERGVPTWPGIGSRKARTLLKLLAVERGRVVPVDRIVAVLWGRTPPRRAEDNVASLVSRLRAWLGPAIVAGGRDGYRLGSAPEVVVDLDVAAAQLAAVARRLTGGEAAAVAAVAGRVLELLGNGEALPEDRDEDWSRPARTQAAELVRQARHLAAEAALYG